MGESSAVLRGTDADVAAEHRAGIGRIAQAHPITDAIDGQ